MKRNTPVAEVDGSTVAMIPTGQPIGEKVKVKSCSRLNGRYALSRAGDMYLIEGCQKRLFPDWETYLEHSKKRRSKSVYELSEDEFHSLKPGSDIASVLDEDFRSQDIVETEADVIPLREACSGVNGRYVSYYSKVYKIERCRKREVMNPTDLLRRRSSRLIELSSEQWISLPDGKSI